MLSSKDLAFARLARDLISPSKVDECLREIHESDSCLKSLLIDKGYLAREDVAALEELALSDRPTRVRKRVNLNGENLDSILGQRVAGYKLLKVLGSGGKGVVFAGRNSEGQVRAVKILKPEAAGKGESTLRFNRESTAMNKLTHPNIVKVFGTGVDRGLHYILMEYVPGASLWEVLKAHGQLSVKASLKVAFEMCRALRHAHEQGIVHRDVKPQNIMVLPDNRVKLTDFGVAHCPDAEKLFRKDVAVGTAHFMAPEQSRGQTVDGRADLYALGVVLFHCLTGKWPFQGKTRRELISKHRNEPAPCPRSLRPELPREVSELVLRCLEKDPAWRFTGAKAVMRAIRVIWAGLKRKRSRRPRASRKQRRRAS